MTNKENETGLPELEAAIVAQIAADERVNEAVEYARSWGTSWAAIAVRLDVSRQAAWERYSNQD